VVVDDHSYLFDFGPGVVRRASEAAMRGVTGLQPMRLTHAFATHLHHDHTAGLPDLLLTPWTGRREEPLHLFGPPGTSHLADCIHQAYSEDIRIRLEGREPANDTGHCFDAHDVDPGVVYEDERVTIEAFLVDHGDWERAYGYKVTGPDRTVVISGDTTKCAELERQASGVDVLVHEVYYEAGLRERTPEWQAYHTAFHTSAPDLGDLAAAARPGVLVLTHTLLMGGTMDDLVAEIRSRYDGEIVAANDLDVI
jgi:ribonuclease BN (tRNA processing enzyme)